MTAYRRLARPVLFRIGHGDAETTHEWTLNHLAGLPPWVLSALRRRYAVSAPTDVFGVRFPNPVGLAAGMDKNGVALPAWPALGFGFVEVGTVTWHAQPGNDRPRLFRLPTSEALINRMGFNNTGAAALAHRLGALRRARAGVPGPAAESAPAGVPGAAGEPGPAGVLDVPLGISLGKSKVTPLDEAVADYLASFQLLQPYADYVAVNVSSPNTPGLRRLQDRGHLDELLAALREAAGATPRPAADGMSGGAGETAGDAGGGVRGPGRATPLLVKLAPDLTEAAVAEALAVCLDRGAAGVIAANTTLDRTGLAPPDLLRGEEAGGLSGAPLARRTRELVSFIHRETAGALPVIGVGGILHPDDAVALMDAGASLVQLYTGLVYRGPALVRDTVRALIGAAGRPPRAALAEGRIRP